MSTLEVQVTQRFDPRVLDFLWKHPTMYRALGDDFLPEPETMNLSAATQIEGLDIYVAFVMGYPIGTVSYRRQTSPIVFETHVGFLPQARGVVAKVAIIETMRDMFEEHGAVKLTAQLARDQRAALYMAHTLGYVREGVNRSASLRNGSLVDLIYLGVTKDAFRRRYSLWQ